MDMVPPSRHSKPQTKDPGVRSQFRERGSFLRFPNWGTIINQAVKSSIMRHSRTQADQSQRTARTEPSRKSRSSGNSFQIAIQGDQSSLRNTRLDRISCLGRSAVREPQNRRV